MLILIPEQIHPQPLERLRMEHEVVYDETLFTRRGELLSAAQKAHAIIVRNRTVVGGELLTALQLCRAVGRLGVGLDNIDLDGCREKGIEVIPAYGANARSVAEYVLTCAMMLLRFSHFNVSADLADGLWKRPVRPEGAEVGGRTLGIIGFGSIGQLTGDLAHRVGMKVVAYDPSPKPTPAVDYPHRMTSLNDVLQTSDVVSLHLPLTTETRGIMDRNRLGMMPAGSVIINAARGGIIDEAALADALRSGHLAGAALDVFAEEPLRDGSILRGVPNLLLTPHIAGVTADSELRVGQMVCERILSVLSAG